MEKKLGYQIIAVGVGSAFTMPVDGDINNCDFQSNFAIRKNGKILLVDCGSDARFALMRQGIKLPEIDAVYISHLHKV